MQIISPAFEDNQMIPSKYTCDGNEASPPLNFVDVPAGAKSLALIMDDPDAPGQTWTHWVVWNIDPKTTGLPENSVGAASEGLNSSGSTGYGGPCPPAGVHRYFFKLYALDTEIQMSASSTKDDLLYAIDGHILDSAELVGIYEKIK